MACALSQGRGTQCNDSIGGLDFIEFAEIDTLGAITYDVTDTDVVTAFAGTPVWYKYELNSSANNYVENIISDADAGTTYFEQVLTLSLKRLDAVSTKEIKLMAYGLNHVRITDRNGNVFIMGLEKGAKITSGSSATGGALGDFSGYNLTISANEKTGANFYTGS